ncbi:DUF2721 domain-containing protein [Sandaracinomonas limnophila]|uniref:DUF2721 domain-containing protein n=1 Tax=Sandaracinomonas limnophila TaxID=1862386 RepID=A0A437PW43_9BACT|nr:DUF2721 domain-containing protein [Sandaracinomonas limnophila]RVU26485.1 DUF2721 domain-containing protein [Sandaracinomonas limnophila]
MDELAISTPALLFSIISLLMIAFTNRFMSMASLIRDLHERFLKQPDKTILIQIKNLRKRISMIRNMQIIAITSLLVSILCMFFIFWGMDIIAKWLFVMGLIGLSISLIISAYEIMISTEALDAEISDMEEEIKKS